MLVYYECGKYNMKVGSVAGIVVGISLAAVGILVFFLFGIKKRMVNGKIKYVCRKSTKRLTCFNKRPRSYEEYLNS